MGDRRGEAFAFLYADGGNAVWYGAWSDGSEGGRAYYNRGD